MRLSRLAGIFFFFSTALIWGAGGGEEGMDSSEKETAVLRFVNWASAEDATRSTINEGILEFQRLNPHIQVENIPVPFGQISQQVVTMTAGGEAPDVIQQEAWMPFELVGMNGLEDLENWADPGYLDSVWPTALEAGRYQGKLIAVPWALTPFGMWYNKDVLAQAGIGAPAQNWEELQDHLEILKDSSLSVDTLGVFTAAAKYGTIHGWTWMWALGARPLENGQAGIDTPEFRETLAWYRKMVKEGYTTGGWKLREFREAFARGELAYAFDGPYLKGIMASINGDITEENINDVYAVAPFPFGEKSATAMSFHQLAMSSKSDNKEAAWKFIEFLTSSPVVIEKYLLPMGAILPLESQVKGEYASSFADPIGQGFINHVLPHTQGIPFNPEYSQVADLIISQGIQKACFTDEPIERIAADLEAAVNKVYGW